MQILRLAAQANVTALVLWTVVAADRVRFATPFDNPVQRSDDAFGRQREIDLDSQAFPIEIIDDVEQADAASVGKLVMHEVHRPALVDRSRHGQWQRLLAHTKRWRGLIRRFSSSSQYIL